MKKYYSYIIIGIILVLITSVVRFISNKNYETSKASLADIKSTYSFIITEQKKLIQTLEEDLQRKQIVTVSFYHPASRGINSDNDPTNTAIMVTPTVGRTVAISNELFLLGWLGNKIYIEGYGIFYAEDRMSKSIKGKCLDICVGSKKIAFRQGKKLEVIAMRL